jgi:S-adenosylmethionine uptake transporter
MATRSQPLGILIPFAVATLGIALFSAMDAVMKGLSLAIGAYNALFWRLLVGILISGTIFLARGGRRPGPAAMRLHLIRGILGAAMAFLFFWGLARVPLAQGVALSFIAPLIALYLAALFLKEKIGRAAIFASLLGFAGVLVILSGQAAADLGPEAFRGALAILASAMLYAYNIILMRQQALVAQPVEIAFFMSVIMGACFLFAAPFLAVPPPLGLLPEIAGAALLAFLSLMFLSWAYARAEAQYLVPVEYTAFVWAALFGILLFREEVKTLTLAGTAMIVAACLIAARRRAPGAIESAP